MFNFVSRSSHYGLAFSPTSSFETVSLMMRSFRFWLVSWDFSKRSRFVFPSFAEPSSEYSNKFICFEPVIFMVYVKKGDSSLTSSSYLGVASWQIALSLSSLFSFVTWEAFTDSCSGTSLIFKVCCSTGVYSSTVMDPRGDGFWGFSVVSISASPCLAAGCPSSFKFDICLLYYFS